MTDEKDGTTNDDLAAMFQREFLSLHEKLDRYREETKAETQAFRTEVNQRFEETNGEIAGISQQLNIETTERDRMQKILEDHTDQLCELASKAA